MSTRKNALKFCMTSRVPNCDFKGSSPLKYVLIYTTTDLERYNLFGRKWEKLISWL